MSDKGLEEFLQALLSDADIQEQMKAGMSERAVENTHELAALAVEVASENGFRFSADAVRASIDQMIRAGQPGAELTGEELDRVAGGIDTSRYALEPSLNTQLVQSFQLTQIKTLP